MKKKYQKTFILLLSLIIGGGLLITSCSDWTDNESIDLNEPNIEDYPELYAQYLENLRSYKNSDHKYLYAWFDNSEKAPYSRAQHISDLPDSLDVVSLLYPDELAAFELEEIAALRENKQTKVVYGISYERIKKAYEQMVKEQTAQDENYEAPDFINYLNEEVDSRLIPADTYDYDGVIIGYKGQSTIYMTDGEKVEYQACQEAFISKFSAWKSSHSDKFIIFEGCPQYLLDNSILASCKHIILNTLNVNSTGELSLEAMQALVDGVPTDRFVVAAYTVSLDTTDKTTGYYANGARGVIEAAYWVTEKENGFKKAGLGIYNIQNDYYNPAFTYQYARQSIHIMNPAPIK